MLLKKIEKNLWKGGGGGGGGLFPYPLVRPSFLQARLLNNVFTIFLGGSSEAVGGIIL